MAVNAENSQLIVEHVKNLPVLSQVTTRVMERMQSPTATLKEIADLIKTDSGLTSKILRLANSSYYSIPGGVTDVPKALQYLGFTTVSQLVLATSVFGSFKTEGSKEFPLDQFWKHSFAVGLAAEVAATQLQIENSKDAFTCGLLHDVGKLVLIEILPNQLHEIITLAKENKSSFIDAERELGLINHAKLGVSLAKHWNLPEVISRTIEHHHDEFTNNSPKEHVLVAWANSWVHELAVGHSGDYSPDHAENIEKLGAILGMTNQQKITIQSKFELEFEKAGAILSGHS